MLDVNLFIMRMTHLYLFIIGRYVKVSIKLFCFLSLFAGIPVSDGSLKLSSVGGG